jgi:hypothetical protein
VSSTVYAVTDFPDKQKPSLCFIKHQDIKVHGEQRFSSKHSYPGQQTNSRQLHAPPALPLRKKPQRLTAYCTNEHSKFIKGMSSFTIQPEMIFKQLINSNQHPVRQNRIAANNLLFRMIELLLFVCILLLNCYHPITWNIAKSLKKTYPEHYTLKSHGYQHDNNKVHSPSTG